MNQDIHNNSNTNNNPDNNLQSTVSTESIERTETIERSETTERIEIRETITTHTIATQIINGILTTTETHRIEERHITRVTNLDNNLDVNENNGDINTNSTTNIMGVLGEIIGHPHVDSCAIL